jgi:hypothetical protein
MPAASATPTGASEIQRNLPRLVLLTDMLDERWKELGSEDSAYGMARYARARQDEWSDDEHREYWEAHCPLWPVGGRRGRMSNREGLAFALLLTKVKYDLDSHDEARARLRQDLVPDYEPPEAIRDTDEAIAFLMRRRSDLRDRDVLDTLEHMERELDDPHPTVVRVPRVMTPEERNFDAPLLPFLRRNTIGRRTIRLPAGFAARDTPATSLDHVAWWRCAEVMRHGRNAASRAELERVLGTMRYFNFNVEEGKSREHLHALLVTDLF